MSIESAPPFGYDALMIAVPQRFWVCAAFVSVAVLGLAGCGNSTQPNAASPASSTASASWSRPDAPPDPHTLLRAGATALAQVPDSALVFIESETDDAGTWKVQVATADGTEQETKIGVDGITVLVGPTPHNDGDADKANRRDQVQAARLDYQAAVQKALAAVPDGSITQLSLTDRNAAVVWQADVWDTYLVEHQVTIDAASGEVTANKQV